MDIASAMATAGDGPFGQLIVFCSDMAIGMNGWREDCYRMDQTAARFCREEN